MSDHPFDPAKPVETRAGVPARIICTDKLGEDSIVALITEGVGDQAREYVEIYPATGRWAPNAISCHDLINPPAEGGLP